MTDNSTPANPAVDPTRAVTEDIAKFVLKTVDAGLTRGLGYGKPGQMCVEAAVSYAYGLPNSDRPPCVSEAVRSLKIKLNDSTIWETGVGRVAGEKVRAAAMRRIAIAQLGTAGVVSDNDFLKAVYNYVTGKLLNPEAEQQRRDAAIAKLQKYIDRIRAGQTVEDYVSYTQWTTSNIGVSFHNPDPFNDLRIDTVDGAKSLVEDIVQILIKLGSPGAQYLYLTLLPTGPDNTVQ